MPQGIGPVGIYHSHPFKSKIFHSHTDDTTLLSLSNQFPNCVSLVTNGEEINYYQMGKNSETKSINIEFIEPFIPKFLLFSMEELIEIKVNKKIIENKDNINIKIVNLLRNYLENAWKELELIFKGKKIEKTEVISNYLTTKLIDQPIKISLSKNNEKISLNINNESNNLSESLSLNVNLRVPIYIVNENRNFNSISEIIKTELVSNNILQKIFMSSINFGLREIIIPEENYLNLSGFFIKILCFNKELNQGDISRKAFELVYKLTAMFESYSNMELNKRVKTQIKQFFEDIKELSKKFIWKKEMTTILKTYEKRLNL